MKDMTAQFAANGDNAASDSACRLWRARQLTTASVFAITAVAAVTLMPVAARAADCGVGENPAGTTCDTTTNPLATLDSSAPTYINRGTLNNTVSDGVLLGDGTAIFTNNGIFNNSTTAGALNFNSAGATFINNGTFNSSMIGGIAVNADGTFTNNGIFNDIAADSFTGGNLTFNNVGTYNILGGTITLGTGVFTNSGTLNIGAGTGAVADTNLTGDYTQTSTGTLKLRTNWGTGAADKLVVSGTADLNGGLAPTFTNITGGVFTRTFTVLGAGTLTLNGLSVVNTAAITNSLAANGNDLELTSTINLTNPNGGALTGNAAAMAGTISTIFANGAAPSFLQALVNIPTNAEYVRALQSLGPVADGNRAASTLTTSSTFANQLLSCRVRGEGDAYAVIREGQCVWARATGRRTDTGSTTNGPGSTDSTMLISTGAQVNIGGPWRLGGGIAYEEPTSYNAFGRSETQRFHLGGVVKYNPGPWLFALGLNGGWGNSDNSRFVSFGGFGASAKSSNESDYISTRFTAAYLMPFGSFYMKPQVDIAQTNINRGGYTESSAGGIALSVQGTSLSVWSYAPSLEVGMQTRLASDNILRPYGKIGGTWQDKDSISTTASFVGLGGPAFVMTSSMDRAFLDLGGGLDVIAKDGSVLRLQLDGQYGESTSTHSGSAKFSMKF